MSGKSKEEVAAECAGMRWGDFKPVLTDATVAHLQPIQVLRPPQRRTQRPQPLGMSARQTDTLESSRASPQHRPREDGRAHPADT